MDSVKARPKLAGKVETDPVRELQVSDTRRPAKDSVPLRHLRQIERRQWWLWASAAFIALLLTIGLASFAFSFSNSQGEIFYLLKVPQAVYGLLV
jgi:hypothetical protein